MAAKGAGRAHRALGRRHKSHPSRMARPFSRPGAALLPHACRPRSYPVERWVAPGRSGPRKGRRHCGFLAGIPAPLHVRGVANAKRQADSVKASQPDGGERLPSTSPIEISGCLSALQLHMCLCPLLRGSYRTHAAVAFGHTVFAIAFGHTVLSEACARAGIEFEGAPTLAASSSTT